MGPLLEVALLEVVLLEVDSLEDHVIALLESTVVHRLDLPEPAAVPLHESSRSLHVQTGVALASAASSIDWSNDMAPAYLINESGSTNKQENKQTNQRTNNQTSLDS